LPLPEVTMQPAQPGPAVQLLHQTYAMVLAGGRGSRLHQLTDWRAKPAVPFAGKFKIIDFALSNCVNSGLRHVGVLTQYKAQSLIRHVTRCYASLDAGLGEFVDVVPAQQKDGNRWYGGTADAVCQNLDLVREAQARWVLVLAGDHVYKMDYGNLLEDHFRHGAQLTVACTEVPLAEACHFGVLSIDRERRITAFAEKPEHPTPMPGRSDVALASMGIYVFNADYLRQQLLRDAADGESQHDFGRDILPQAVAQTHVLAHDYASSCVNMVGQRPYWRDVGTLDAYWAANMDLVTPLPELNLYDDDWPIRSVQQQLAPAKFVFDEDRRRGMAVDSVVASGCIVSGAAVRRSMLFSKARVEEGSLIEDTLLLPGVQVGAGAIVRRAIIDKNCVLPSGIRIGCDAGADRQRFHFTRGGVTLVTPAMLEQDTNLRL